MRATLVVMFVLAVSGCGVDRSGSDVTLAEAGSALEVARTAVELQLARPSQVDDVERFVESLDEDDFEAYRTAFTALHEELHRTNARESTDQMARFSAGLHAYLAEHGSTASEKVGRSEQALSGMCEGCPYPCSHSSGWCPEWPCSFGEMCDGNYCWFCTDMAAE